MLHCQPWTHCSHHGDLLMPGILRCLKLLRGMTDALVSIIDTALTSVDESLAKLCLGDLSGKGANMGQPNRFSKFPGFASAAWLICSGFWPRLT